MSSTSSSTSPANLRWISVNSAVVGQDYTWHGTVALPSGGLGSFDIIVDAHADASEGFEIFGSKGHIKASTFQPFWKRASDVEVYLEDTGARCAPHPRDTNAFKIQLDDFATAIRNGGGENPSPAHGIAAVRLIEAAAHSTELDGAKGHPMNPTTSPPHPTRGIFARVFPTQTRRITGGRHHPQPQPALGAVEPGSGGYPHDPDV